eukprot:52657-Hanusia_phi.AAC.2
MKVHSTSPCRSTAAFTSSRMRLTRSRGKSGAPGDLNLWLRPWAVPMPERTTDVVDGAGDCLGVLAPHRHAGHVDLAPEHVDVAPLHDGLRLLVDEREAGSQHPPGEVDPVPVQRRPRFAAGGGDHRGSVAVVRGLVDVDVEDLPRAFPGHLMRAERGAFAMDVERVELQEEGDEPHRPLSGEGHGLWTIQHQPAFYAHGGFRGGLFVTLAIKLYGPSRSSFCVSPTNQDTG